MSDAPTIPRRTPRLKLTRDEKARLTRENLLASGCQVVGAEGYASASIARIADGAGVAHGTFYNYFDDRQALFDELLPYEGLRMRAFIESAVRDTPRGLTRDHARFRAFLEYVAANPGFYRVLYEAEVSAPLAHSRHMGTVIGGYRRSFSRAISEGHLGDLSGLELESLIYQLLGLRAYAAMQIVRSEPGARPAVIASASRVYELLLGPGLLT